MSIFVGSAIFFANSILLGFGLAMDAFSVSAANGIANPHMTLYEKFRISGTFALFQFIMPMLGWIIVHGFVLYFNAFAPFIPWIALIILLFLGIRMIIEGLRETSDEGTAEAVSAGRLKKRTLFAQGVATSIDALSVGFTISGYNTASAFTASLIIAVVTLILCLLGVNLGIRIGQRITGRATVFGGMILIFIGLEIFIKGVFL